MTEELWLVWSIEHGMWWLPNWRGYTENRAEAGRYTYEEALKIVKQANIGDYDTPNEAMILDTERETE